MKFLSIKKSSMLSALLLISCLVIACSENNEEVPGNSINTKDCNSIYSTADFSQTCLSVADAITLSSVDNMVLTSCIHDIPDTDLDGVINIHIIQYKAPGNAELVLNNDHSGCDGMMEIDDLGDEAFICPDDDQLITRVGNVIIIISPSSIGSPDCINGLSELLPIANAIIDAL